MELDKENFKRIQWNNSKRLIFGSLLIVSFDRFRSTSFAVVADSDRKTLSEHGTFKVKMFRTRRNQKIPKETNGILLEATSAYFEAYYHVLSALQLIREETLPFQKYIVSCKNSIDIPKYLSTATAPSYDLQPVLLKDSNRIPRTYNKKPTVDMTKHRITVPNQEQWPSKEELGMDESQRQAFISALTKEFVLIQGPPGTGKTFIGLQIAKTLLNNITVWREKYSSSVYRNENISHPSILVVGFTNHALDQFVEGIITFLMSTDNGKTVDNLIKLVRIGGQCRSPQVEKYSIKNLRSKVTKKVHSGDVIKECEGVRTEILNCRAILKLIQGQNFVLSIKCLSNFMSNEHRLQLAKHTETDWLDWLNVSKKRWMKEVIKSISVKHSKTKRKGNIHRIIKKDSLNTVTEAEYAYSERSVDEDSEFRISEDDFGVNISSQLDDMLQEISDKTWQELLKEEAGYVLDELRANQILRESTITRSEDLLKLSLQDRWQFYRYWLRLYVDDLKAKLQMAETKFNQIFEQYKEARKEIDEEILREATVIAMTTTGAARYHTSLKKIGPKITIIEEAAEVPEAHIVSAINPNCEHLILIGDHKQLQPKPAVRELASRYNLSVSLFERMVNNGVHYNCLKNQHRMRPEISQLVRHIYGELEDNENVLQYENIRGIQANMFFITHEEHEDFNEDMKSFSNKHEAEYLTELCFYLLKQGYNNSEISIITPYTGQMVLIRREMEKKELAGVNISVLDMYQGEENEIILLSLVRSNNQGDIGFLKSENRICVALSRAKKGLFIIGNSETLTKHSDNWKIILSKIKSTKPQNASSILKHPYSGSAIGKALPLYCENHPEIKGILAKLPNDFSKAPEGGCGIPCEMRLNCGHVCRLKCHPIDRNHTNYICKSSCPKKCIEGHVCPKLCHYPDDCNCNKYINRTLQCGHIIRLPCRIDPAEHICQTQVNHLLACGHIVALKCYEDYREYNCIEKVIRRRAACGHTYERKCYDTSYENTTKCHTKVDKIFPDCHHKINIFCFLNIKEQKCEEYVNKTLDCGHVKRSKCWEVKAGVLTCIARCLKVCKNEHICEKNCHYPQSCYCNKGVEKVLPNCGHTAILECSENADDAKNCLTNVALTLKRCGHIVKVPCHFERVYKNLKEIERTEWERKFRCPQVVEAQLPQCGHTINITCWQKSKINNGKIDDLEKLNIKCPSLVKIELDCGHSKEVLCLEKRLYENGRQNFYCNAEIEIKLQMCGHNVKVECGKQNNVKDIDCNESVTYTYPVCKHDRQVYCYQLPYFKAVLEQRLSPYQKTFALTKEEKYEIPPCDKQIRKTFKCGHVMLVNCHQFDKASCNEECKTRLVCGHYCVNLCNVCHGNIMHKECEMTCNKYLVCGHKCESLKCMQCSPCQKQCSYSCEHSICQLKCSDICKPSCEPCKWVCPHFQCSKLCWEKCNRPICQNDCELTLKCGHKCPGFCSEPCPQSCLNCDPSMLKNIQTNKNSKTNIVTIVNCGHSFDYQYLDEYISNTANELKTECPSCRTLFYKHPRYDHILKRKKAFNEEMKGKISDLAKTTPFFPVLDSSVRQRFESYLGSFLSYLKVQRYIERNEKELSAIGIFENIAIKTKKMIVETPTSKFQSWMDISNEIFRIYVIWILRLISNNDKILNTEFRVENSKASFCKLGNGNTIRTGNEQMIKTETLKRDRSNLRRLNLKHNNDKECHAEEEAELKFNHPTNHISNTSVLSGQEIVTKIKTTHSRDHKREETKKLLNVLIPFLKDEPHFKEATTYPELDRAIGIHDGEWSVCRKGHFTPCLLSDICFACSNVNLTSFVGTIKGSKHSDEYCHHKADPIKAETRGNKNNVHINQSFKHDTHKSSQKSSRFTKQDGDDGMQQNGNKPSETFSIIDYFIKAKEMSKKSRGHDNRSGSSSNQKKNFRSDEKPRKKILNERENRCFNTDFEISIPSIDCNVEFVARRKLNFETKHENLNTDTRDFSRKLSHSNSVGTEIGQPGRSTEPEIGKQVSTASVNDGSFDTCKKILNETQDLTVKSCNRPPSDNGNRSTKMGSFKTMAYSESGQCNDMLSETCTEYKSATGYDRERSRNGRRYNRNTRMKSLMKNAGPQEIEVTAEKNEKSPGRSGKKFQNEGRPRKGGSRRRWRQK